ncbi:MaoC/PaaZ C-terminal domain-containing protein [Actinotalea sp. M2MS4P-6]|uniref:MaoC family dehydratase n=1 Tax=Actinotalea sp. M2MS4P-6 TaxID=2983762 RepID=UPI0021E4CD92|nr:MaoC/PaaZ C-terminal domain-containing protein [Actinotalea sp. M2MS4P-6]MCV2395298.1 MaoC/PaaZ C-terminal domain-containing protein [Actinotalea sp. M2MS4P-6]
MSGAAHGASHPGRAVHGDGPVIELGSVPSLGASQRRGLAGSAAAAATRRRDVAADALDGTTLLAQGLTTDPDRLTAYQHLVGAPAQDRLPAGFVHVLAFPLANALMVRDGFPLPLLGLVHLANEVTQQRPVVLGEEVDVAVHAERLTAHHRGVSVDVVAEVGVAGEPVWRGVSTYLAKGYRLDGATADRAERPEWHAPQPTGAWRLEADLGRRYAAVSGDRNPIHTSTLAAKAFGFPRTIAHGMYTAARALAHLDEPDAFTWRAEFAAPIVLPSTVSVRAGTDGPARVLDAWAKRHQLHVTVTPRG